MFNHWSVKEAFLFSCERGEIAGCVCFWCLLIAVVCSRLVSASWGLYLSYRQRHECSVCSMCSRVALPYFQLVVTLYKPLLCPDHLFFVFQARKRWDWTRERKRRQNQGYIRERAAAKEGTRSLAAHQTIVQDQATGRIQEFSKFSNNRPMK